MARVAGVKAIFLTVTESIMKNTERSIISLCHL